MERPGSARGMMKPAAGNSSASVVSSSAMSAPADRPGTGSRGAPPPSSASRPMGTAMGTRGPMGGGSIGAPPGTAFKRLGTAQGRPGTGAQGGAAGGRTGTNVQVDSRPITNHGISGMKAAAGGGGGRQVLDKNYFVNELRQKRAEVANVTQSMRVCGVWGSGLAFRWPMSHSALLDVGGCGAREGVGFGG